MAPLQKRAWYSLVIGVVFAVALLVVFITEGDVTAFNEDQGFRVTVYALWIGGLVAYLIVMNLTLLRPKPNQFDERDRLIMGRASRIQLLAIIFSLVAWTIALTEVYSDQGQIPVVFPNLIMISILIIFTLAQSAGILIGYWRMGRYG